MPSISSRTICTTFSCTRHPAGSHVHSPEPSWRTRPARTMSLCDSASASAGAWRSVGRSSCETRIGRPTVTRVRLAAGAGAPVPGTGRLGRACRVGRVPSARGEPMPYEVPPLPYDYAALEPHIDEQTMRLHHDKHHQAYVDKANDALSGTDLDGRPIEEVIRNL